MVNFLKPFYSSLPGVLGLEGTVYRDSYIIMIIVIIIIIFIVIGYHIAVLTELCGEKSSFIGQDWRLYIAGNSMYRCSLN